MIEVSSFPDHLEYHEHEAVRRAGRRLEELGLEAYSFHAPFADDIDISAPNPGQRNVALQEILQATEAAAILQVRYFVIHPGPEHAIRPTLPGTFSTHGKRGQCPQQGGAALPRAGHRVRAR